MSEHFKPNVMRRAAAVLALAWLSGCGQPAGDRPTEIAWDRDTCEYCRMTVSDRAFAAQAYVGQQHRHYVFDDVGCLVNWLHDHAPASDQARLWVADYRQRDRAKWLDARSAWYVQGQTTPMDYGYGAVEAPEDGAVDFETARARLLARNAER